MSQFIDHVGTRNPICPWCGVDHDWWGVDHDWWGHDWEGLAGKHECSRCGKSFEWERQRIPEWTTKKLHPCGTCGRMLAVWEDGQLEIHNKPGTFERCYGEVVRPTREGT